MPERLFVIDAFAHIFQFFYAIKGLTGPDGEPVNAVYGFARMLDKLRQDHRPDYLAVAFDAPGELLRRRTYEDYKANRPPMPDALERQIPLIHQLLQVQGIPELQAEGFEADDVLATAARQATERGIHAVIVTTDKDAEQLISETTSVLHVRKDEEQLLDPEGLMKAKCIEPRQVVEVMSLAGDSTDNVPGVPGIGPKTALKLIAEFGSVENLYAHLDQVPGAGLREKLRAHRGDVDVTRELVTLRADAPVEVDWEACRNGVPDADALDGFYRALGFQSLRREAPAPAQRSLFGEERAPSSLDGLPVDYSCVNTLDDLDELAARLAGLDLVSVDLETTSLEPRNARIVGVAFAWEPHKAAYVALDGPPGAEVCPVAEALAVLKPLLEAERPRKVGQNLKYDIAVMKNYDIAPGGLACDSMVASYLLYPSSRSHGLDALARRHLNYETVKIAELIGAGPLQRTMDSVPLDKVTRYSCEDADLALQLCDLLGARLEEEELGGLFRTLELPLVPVLADMEWTGFRVDTAELARLSAEFAGQIADLEKQVYEQAGEEFNLNSPQQLSRILFEKLELPTPRNARRTTGYSTASDVLQDLRRDHPIADTLLRYRELSKLKSTYADALLATVNPNTGRIHASFNQTVTATGRLSSSEPNLQNIPVRTPLGRRIRRAFIPGADDMSLLSADYSQVELRVMAHCSGDPTLRKAFEEGRDIHRFVAAQVHGVREDEVTDAMRQQAKAVNFGIIYGLSAYGLSRAIEVPVEEAEEFIRGYFARYPRVKQFIGATVDRARRDGFVRTLAGRKRRIEGLDSSGASRSAAERIAVNTVIQGSAADLIKKAMIEIHRGLPGVSPRANMLVQIHDELVFEVPDTELEATRRFVAETMTGALQLSVPLKVETSTGKTWAETK